MMVRKAKSAYSTIPGCMWLNKMKTIVSTFYQMPKFPNENKIELLISDQKSSMTCYMDTLKGKIYTTK